MTATMVGKILVLGLFILGYVQCDVIARVNTPAIIEDLRRAGGSRVVGGWPAVEGQIPHQVSLRMVNGIGSVSSCGGSLIHHHWVLTAAHCLANRHTFVVRLGLTNLTRPEYMVESPHKHIHPEYNEVAAGVQTADIALLRLDRYIPYSPTIQPCRLQNTDTMNRNYAGVVLTVSGYGLTDDSANGGTTSEILLWTLLRGISNAECLMWYPNSAVIKDETICAQYYNHTSQSACSGDSGGPLTMVDVDGKPTMVGVVSFGPGSGCNNHIPTGYVRPGHYHGWYQQVTGMSFDWSYDQLEPQPEPEVTEPLKQVNFVGLM